LLLVESEVGVRTTSMIGKVQQRRCGFGTEALLPVERCLVVLRRTVVGVSNEVLWQVCTGGGAESARRRGRRDDLGDNVIESVVELV
jgi:hypothetical protein